LPTFQSRWRAGISTGVSWRGAACTTPGVAAAIAAVV